MAEVRWPPGSGRPLRDSRCQPAGPRRRTYSSTAGAIKRNTNQIDARVRAPPRLSDHRADNGNPTWFDIRCAATPRQIHHRGFYPLALVGTDPAAGTRSRSRMPKLGVTPPSLLWVAIQPTSPRYLPGSVLSALTSDASSCQHAKY